MNLFGCLGLGDLRLAVDPSGEFTRCGWQFASCGRVIGDEPLLHCLVRALAEHGMEATNRLGAQAHALLCGVPSSGHLCAREYDLCRWFAS